ncbi:hypothetical protein UPYG_G00164030, partial [Umbra pygmaea]
MMATCPAKRYYVVSFMEDNSVNVIPSSWFNDDQSWWPSYTSDEKINKAIKNCEQPCHGWKKYSARILCAKDDYLEARQKMSQYFNSDTAGLQSEDEGSQRKRKKKKRHVSDSEPEERSDDDYITQKIPLNLPAIPRPFPVSQSPDPSARLYDLDEGRSYTNLNFPTSSRPQFSAMNPNPSDISPLTLPDGRDVQQFNSPSLAPGYQNKQGFTGTSTFPLSCRTDS